MTYAYPLPPGAHLTGDLLRQVTHDVDGMYTQGLTLRQIAERTGLSYGKVQRLRSLSRTPARRYAWQEIR
jgi:Helix-turn-helix domain